MFWDFLSETLSVRPGSINIFSIEDREQKTVDIHFYVLTNSGYLRPEKLHSALAAHKKKVYTHTVTLIEICGNKSSDKLVSYLL